MLALTMAQGEIYLSIAGFGRWTFVCGPVSHLYDDKFPFEIVLVPKSYNEFSGTSF